MSGEAIAHIITKKELLKINEDDVMFITNPGRQGDYNGLFIITEQNNTYKIHRIEGLLYPDKNMDKSECVSLKDLEKHFPKWLDAMKHGDDKNYNGKYKYLYMGLGNGLAVDNRVFNQYKTYLDKEVDEYFKLENIDDREGLEGCAMYNAWQAAFLDMIEDNNNKLL